MSPPTSPVVEVIAASKLYGRVEALHGGVARQEFLSHVEGLGMTLIREILVGEGPAVHGAPEPCEFNSFLFTHAASPDER